jgi:hypothetical protein
VEVAVRDEARETLAMDELAESDVSVVFPPLA